MIVLRQLHSLFWCPEWSGFSVRIQMDSLSGMKWNGCPESNGFTVRNGLEYATIAVVIARKTLRAGEMP